MRNTIITGTGSYIPQQVITNEHFGRHEFYDADQSKIETPVDEIIEKFKSITGIEERRWADDNLLASDIATKAATEAIQDANINPEEIDYIILAHNFGDFIKGTVQTDILPSLASRVKHNLGIENPFCIPYDILFGCPGWVQGLIQANTYIRAGEAKKCLVIGTETLSRVVDVNDRDTMIFADGAGACIVEAKDEDEKRGILTTKAASHTKDEAYYLHLGASYRSGSDSKIRYIKMDGRKIYEYALTNVPQAMRLCLDASEVDINQLDKIFIHQANEKMDEAILKRFYRLYKTKVPKNIMPMSIRFLGNSSVATVPTLFDLVRKQKMNGQTVNSGDYIMFASVGAGMNINAVMYRC